MNTINIIDRDPEQVIYEIKEIVHEELIKTNTVTKVLREMLPEVKVLDVLHMSLAVEVYCLKEAIRRYNVLCNPDSKSNLIARMFPDKNMLDMPLSQVDPSDLEGLPVMKKMGNPNLFNDHFKNQGE